VAALGFAEDGGEVAAGEGEALLDVSGDREVGAAAGDAEFLTEDPHGSGAVVDLKDSRSQGAEGIGDASGDGDFFSGEAGWILINLGYALARWASGQQQGGQQYVQDSGVHSGHAIHKPSPGQEVVLGGLLARPAESGFLVASLLGMTRRIGCGLSSGLHGRGRPRVHWPGRPGA